MDISGTQACELPLPPSFTLGCCAFSTVSPSRAPLFPGDRAADLQAKAKEGKLRWGGILSCGFHTSWIETPAGSL